MKIQEIREMIKLVDQSSIEEFVFEQEGTKVKMKKTGAAVQPAAAAPAAAPAVSAPAPASEEAPAPAPAPAAPAKPEAPQTEAAPAPAASDSSLHEIVSPMVGTFYQSPSPDEPAYVQTGDKVSSDTVVCIVEAMKLFNEIEAEVEGEIAEILVKDGQLVEYGQPLFLVRTV